MLTFVARAAQGLEGLGFGIRGAMGPSMLSGTTDANAGRAGHFKYWSLQSLCGAGHGGSRGKKRSAWEDLHVT